MKNGALKLYRQGYFLIEVKVIKHCKVPKKQWVTHLSPPLGRELSSKTYLVNVLSREMGRTKVGSNVSFVKAGIFSKEYFLKGNPNCGGFLCKTLTGVITSK